MTSLIARVSLYREYFLRKIVLLIFLPFLTFVFFIKCGREREGIIVDNSEQITVSSSIANESVVSDSIISDISYIKLEDTEESIGTVRKVIVENDMIIIWDDARKNIWVFSVDGKFLGKISQFGHGKEKYSSIYNISFVEPNIVNVIDGESKTVMSYSTDGKFLSKKTTEGNISDYISHKNNEYSFYYYRYNQLSPNYHFSIQEASGSKKGFFEYKKPFLFVGNGGDYILKSNDEVYLRKPYNDTIFQYQNDALTLKFVFDFGKKAYPTKRIYDAPNLQQVDNIISKEEYVGNISNLLISKKYLLSTFNQQKGSQNILTSVLLRNLNTGKTITYQYLEGTSGNVVPNYPVATDGESFYSLHPSSDVLISFMGLKKSSSYLDSNPVIVKYKYKL